MSIRSLHREWEARSKGRLTSCEYSVHLTEQDAARIAALAEMYPLRSTEQIVTDLLKAALDELENALPYREGERVLEEDEFGDPVYEDAGPGRLFHELTRKHLQRLRESG